MEYKHIRETKVYKYGPEEEFANFEDAQRHVRSIKNKIYTELSLQGFYKSVEKIEEIQGDNLITLSISIKYPVNFFE